MISVLYVDDEGSLLELAKGFLEMKGEFIVDTTSSAKTALDLLQSHRYDAIISDYQMPGMNGIELLKKVRESNNTIPFILFTGRGREEVVIQALNEGADYYLQKGGDPVSLFIELSHKITLSVQKRQAEAALTQSEEQSRVLIDHIQDGAFLSQDGVLLICNETLAKMMGYTREEVTGLPITDLIAPEDLEIVMERHKNRLSGKNLPESYEFRLLHKDGTTRIPVMISVGTGTYQDRPAVIGTLHSMLEERKRESALQKSEQRYRDIYNNANIGLFMSTLDGRYIHVNPYAVRYLGYDSKEDFIQSITDIGRQNYVDPEERGEIARILQTQGFIENYETRFYRKDGRIIWGSFSAKIVTDENGNPVIEGTCQDITDRKEAELALRESEKRLRWVYNSGLLGVMFWNIDGTITDANDRFLEMLGYSRNDLNAGCINGFRLTPPEYADVDIAAVSELLEHGSHKKPYEKEYIKKDGTRVPVVIAGSMLDDDRTHGVGFVLDITERKNAENSLRKVNRQLNLMTEITRHDLINQISLLYGYIELADLQIEDPSLRKIFLQMKTVADVIRSQIAFTRIYQALGSQDPQWLKLDVLLSDSDNSAYASLKQNIQSVEIYADPMIDKVFFNLLDNSLRHGKQVTNMRISSAESEDRLTILWEDDGVGIPPDKKEKIFERGFGENTGLGLYLVREILAQTGITIHETGEAGKGARFEIIVPKGAYRILK